MFTAAPCPVMLGQPEFIQRVFLSRQQRCIKKTRCLQMQDILLVQNPGKGLLNNEVKQFAWTVSAPAFFPFASRCCQSASLSSVSVGPLRLTLSQFHHYSSNAIVTKCTASPQQPGHSACKAQPATRSSLQETAAEWWHAQGRVQTHAASCMGLCTSSHILASQTAQPHRRSA